MARPKPLYNNRASADYAGDGQTRVRTAVSCRWRARARRPALASRPHERARRPGRMAARTLPFRRAAPLVSRPPQPVADFSQKIFKAASTEPQGSLALAPHLESVAMRSVFQWSLGARSLDLGKRTLIMGVVNVTPDSFSDAGQFLDRDQAIAHAQRLLEEGADIIDVG